MTGKMAIEKAIDIVRSSGDENAEEIVEKLNICKNNLHRPKWTQDMILDACEQLSSEKSSQLTVGDFDGTFLPRPITVKNLFGMTVSTFLDTYFDRDKHALHSHSRYEDMDTETMKKRFRKEYLRIKPVSYADFNERYNNENCPCMHTMCKRLGIDNFKWNTMLKELGLPAYHAQRPKRPRKDDGAAYTTESISSIQDRWAEAQGRKRTVILKD